MVSHKEADFPSDNLYKPIIVGSASVNVDNAWRDDGGDNISDKNPTFCELTALYWFWKNQLKNYDIGGLCHYRRYFSHSPLREDEASLLTASDIDSIFETHDVILPKKYYWLKKTVGEVYYKHGAGKIKDIEALDRVIMRVSPECHEAFLDIVNSHSASYCNMFVMRSEEVAEYCEWLFSILFELEQRIDLTHYTKEEKRVFGYLGEILINAWCAKKGYRIKEMPVSFRGDLLKKIYNYVSHSFKSSIMQ